MEDKSVIKASNILISIVAHPFILSNFIYQELIVGKLNSLNATLPRIKESEIFTFESSNYKSLIRNGMGNAKP